MIKLMTLSTIRRVSYIRSVFILGCIIGLTWFAQVRASETKSETLGQAGQTWQAILDLRDQPLEVDLRGLTQVDGQPFDLSQLAGKIVLINFWATWCAPCRHEMPTFEQAAKTLSDEDFIVLAVSVDNKALKGLAYLTKQGFDNLVFAHDDRMQVFRDLGGRGVPHTLILDRQGRDAGFLAGTNDWASVDSLALYRHFLAK